MQPAHPPNSSSVWPTRSTAFNQGSPRSTKFMYYPQWSQAQVQHDQRGSDGRRVSNPMPHYQVRNSPRAHYGGEPYLELHSTMTHAKAGKEPLDTRSPRLGFVRPPEFMPFGQPSVPGRASRPQSARTDKEYPFPYQQCYPRFKPLVAKNFIALGEKTQAEEISALEKAAEKVKADVKMVHDTVKEMAGGEKVSPDELRKAISSLKEKLLDKFGSLQKAFRAVDKDGSNQITREELQRYLEVINLHSSFKPAVLDAMFNLIDADASGEFDFREFSRVMTAGDVLKMETIKDKFDGFKAKQEEEEEKERKRKEYEASLVGMTAQEYEDYWAPTKAMFKQQTSAEMTQVARDKWGKKIKGPYQFGT